jgi:flagellin
MTSVNTHVGANIASANISKVTKEMDMAIERLSSGLRINSAKDDAAGMAIVSKMESQVKGLSQAIRNATDSQNLIDTTESASVEVVNILQRLRELAVQSANDTNTALDRSFIKSEATQLIAEVDRIANQTTWNGTTVLDGTFASKQFQLGANAKEDVTFSVNSIKSADIGNNRVNGTSSINAETADDIAAHTITVTGDLGTATASINANASASDAATAVNAITASTGVTASAVTKVKLHTLGATGTLSFSLSNGAASGGSANISVTVSDTADLRVIKDAVNAVAGTTGIEAVMDSSGNSAIILTHSTGQDIKIGSYDHGTNGTGFEVSVLDQDGTQTAVSTGVATTQLLTDVTTLLSGTGALVTAGSVAAAATLTIDGTIKAAFNAQVGVVTGAQAGAGTNFTVVGTDLDGNALTEVMDINTANGATTTSKNTFATITSITTDVDIATSVSAGRHTNLEVSAVGQLRFDSANSFSATTDNVTSAKTNFLATTASNSSSLSALSSLNLGTVSGSEAAIDILDGAINKINADRSDLGAISNRLDATISNLTSIVTNTQASVSNVRDADFSAETSRLTRAQILNQAATSMLAQANASKQSVLSLLQG